MWRDEVMSRLRARFGETLYMLGSEVAYES